MQAACRVLAAAIAQQYRSSSWSEQAVYARCARVSRRSRAAKLKLQNGFSPALFAFVTNSLIAALRASGLGVRIDGVHVPAVMLMDDLAILARSEREMTAMARVVFEWSYRNRYVLALVDKSHICRGVPRTAADDAARLKTRLTYVPVWKPKYYESKPRIFVPRQIEVQRKVEVGGGG